MGILATFGHLEAHYKQELNNNYTIVDKGYNSFPTNIPGTSYKKALLVGIFGFYYKYLLNLIYLMCLIHELIVHIIGKEEAKRDSWRHYQ